MLELVLVLLAENACSLLSLGNQIVRSGHIIKLVPKYVVFALFNVNAIVSVQDFHNLIVNLNCILANNDATLFLGLHLVVPRVVSNVFDCETLCWVWIQYHCN